MGRFQSCRGMVERALRRAFLDSVLEMYDYEGQDSSDVVTAVTLKGVLTLTINNVEHFTVRLSEVAQRAEDTITEETPPSACHQKCHDACRLDSRKRKFQPNNENDHNKRLLTLLDAREDLPACKAEKQEPVPVVKSEPDPENYGGMAWPHQNSSAENPCQNSETVHTRTSVNNSSEASDISIAQISAVQKSKENVAKSVHKKCADLGSETPEHADPNSASLEDLQPTPCTKSEDVGGSNLPLLDSRMSDQGNVTEPSSLTSARVDNFVQDLSSKASVTKVLQKQTSNENISLQNEKKCPGSLEKELSTKGKLETAKSAPVPSQASKKEESSKLPANISENEMPPVENCMSEPAHQVLAVNVSNKAETPTSELVTESETSLVETARNSSTAVENVFTVKKELDDYEYDDLPVDFTLPSSKRNREGRDAEPEESVHARVTVKEEPKTELIVIEDDDDDDDDSEVDCRQTSNQSPFHSLWYKIPETASSGQKSHKVKEQKSSEDPYKDVFHFSGNTSNSLLRHDCPLCGEVFHIPAFFSTHLTAHRQAYRRTCSICRNSSLTPDALLLHLKTVHGPAVTGQTAPETSVVNQSLVPSVLPYSLNPMSAVASLVSVAAGHGAVDPGRIGGSLMEQLMMSYSGFIPCPVCQLLCPSKPHLILHLRATHADLLAGLVGGGGVSGNHEEGGEEEDVALESVVKEESSNADDEASTSSASFSCFDCSIYFVSQAAYTQHCLLLHGSTSTVSQGTCSVCRRAFDTWKGLQAHYLAAHGVTSFCERCKLGFTTTAELRAHHDATHCAEPRGQTFTCDICSKAFYSQSQCSAHKRSHVSEKSFACQVCGSAFFKRGDLSKHFRTVHAPNRVFNCRFCGKKGTRMDNMRSHVKSHGKHMTRDEILSYIEEVKSA